MDIPRIIVVSITLIVLGVLIYLYAQDTTEHLHIYIDNTKESFVRYSNLNTTLVMHYYGCNGPYSLGVYTDKDEMPHKLLSATNCMCNTNMELNITVPRQIVWLCFVPNVE